MYLLHSTILSPVKIKFWPFFTKNIDAKGKIDVISGFLRLRNNHYEDFFTFWRQSPLNKVKIKKTAMRRLSPY